MARQETNVGNLVDMIQRGELRLPEMQRHYVWTSTKVRDLLDSIYRGYPSGTILVWETSADHNMRDLQISQDRSAFTTYKLLLDGQQRLTSLSAVLRGEPVKIRNGRYIDIAFNLDYSEQAEDEFADSEEDENNEAVDEGDPESVLDRMERRMFSVASRQLLSRPNWVSVSEVFKGEKSEWEFLKRLVSSPADPVYKKYSDRLRKLQDIRKYPYVMEILDRSLSYEEVAEIFVRVNSLGAKLRGSDLALAQITAKWPGSLALFEEFQEKCAKDSGMFLDTGLLVRLLVVFSTKQSRFKTVATIPLKTLEQSWEHVKHGTEFALNFLRSNAGIESMFLLSSPYYLIPIAIYGHIKNYELNRQQACHILRWLYGANMRGHYSGSSETKLDADLAVLFRGGDFNQLGEILIQKFGRLFVEPDDLKHKGQRSPLFSFSYLALKHAGALDWTSGLGLSLGHQGYHHAIEYHHVFPKSLLQRAGYEKAEINEIANMAFISGRANRNISNKPPVAYLKSILEKRGEAALRSQAITIEMSLWEIESYRDFLHNRRVRLAELINRFVDVATMNGKAAAFIVD